MIQIEDWMIVAALIVLLVLSLIYLLYFKISKKLFPKQLNFQKQIKPNEATTALSIDGSGIVKRINMQITENDNSLVNLTIDQSSYIVLGLAEKTDEPNKRISQNGKLMTIELQVDKKFSKSFSIFIHNRSSLPLNTSGNINYELKAPLKPTLKAIIAEI